MRVEHWPEGGAPGSRLWDAVRMVLEAGGPPGSCREVRQAARRGELEVVQLLHGQGQLRLEPEVWVAAVEGGCEAVLECLAAEGCRVGTDAGQDPYVPCRWAARGPGRAVRPASPGRGVGPPRGAAGGGGQGGGAAGGAVDGGGGGAVGRGGGGGGGGGGKEAGAGARGYGCVAGAAGGDEGRQGGGWGGDGWWQEQGRQEEALTGCLALAY